MGEVHLLFCCLPFATLGLIVLLLFVFLLLLLLLLLPISSFSFFFFLSPHLALAGFWDAWNTVYPLLTLLDSQQLGRSIAGWLTAYEEGGWLPK